MNQRNEFLDFLKGVAILCVILIHNVPDMIQKETLSWYHIGQAVPIFMVVSGYLGYAKYKQTHTIEIKNQIPKLFKRVLLPFLIILVIQIFLKIKMGNLNMDSLIEKGGIGPGSYYPYVFIQCALCLPFIAAIVHHYSRAWISAGIMIVLSICFNSLLVYINISDAAYRLLAVRYLCYIYLGCLWNKQGIKSKMTMLILVLISAAFVYLQRYQRINFEPLLINDWRGYNWLGAFYTMGVIYGLNQIYHSNYLTQLKQIFKIFGKHSYEIFLTQMFVFSFIKRRMFVGITPLSLQQILYMLITLILSLAPILIWYYRDSLLSPKLNKKEI